MGGDISVQSEFGKGTTFFIKTKINNKLDKFSLEIN